MKLAALIIALAGPGFAQDLPSGLNAVLRDVVLDEVDGEAWARFRFVAPAIKDGAISYFEALNDFPVLCTEIALPYMRNEGVDAGKIVISISDRFVEFGASDPDATQFFELFSHKDGDCIWEEL